MASKVNVNSLTVVHAGSDGVAPSFPDVCLTPAPPGPPLPIPYPNVAKSTDTAQGTRTVTIEGHPVMVQEAIFATSTGDEAGSAGGVASGTTRGKARFVNYSFDVKFEGQCVPRLGDPMTHNELAAPNTPPIPEVQPPCPMVATMLADDAGPDAQAVPVAPTEIHQLIWDAVNERQWVNLPHTWGPEYGRKVTLTAHIEPRVAGKKATFTVVPDPENPARAKPASLAKRSVTSGADGTVKVVLRLPIYGGARFQVSGKLSTAPVAVESPPITVWRRLYYQMTTMDPAPDGTRFDPPADLMASLQDTFAAVFIDLQPGTKATATTPYLPNVGTHADDLAVAAAALPDDRSPYKLHIIAIDKAERLTVPTEKLYKSFVVESKPFLRWTHGEPAVVRAEFESRKGLGDWRPLEDVQVIDSPDGKVFLRGRVPHHHPWKMLVRLAYRAQRGSSPLGLGGTGGVLLICVGYLHRSYAGAESTLVMRQSMSHEIGHALGLVPATASWHDRDPRDDPYTQKHCHHQTADHHAECVMWYRIKHSGHPTRFCTSDEPRNCAHLLRAEDLSKVKWV